MQTLDAIILAIVHWGGAFAIGLGLLALFSYACSAIAWYLIHEAWAYEMTAHVIWHCWRRTRFTRAPKFTKPIRPGSGPSKKYSKERAAALEAELDAEGVGPAPEFVPAPASEQDGDA